MVAPVLRLSQKPPEYELSDPTWVEIFRPRSRRSLPSTPEQKMYPVVAAQPYFSPFVSYAELSHPSSSH